MSDPPILVTSGCYTYSVDGSVAPVAEPFTVTCREQSVLVTSERVAPGTRLNVDAVYNADGPTDVLLTWASDHEDLPQIATMRYVHDPAGGLTASGTVDSVEHSHELALSAAASFFPLMRVYSGRTLLRLVDAGDGGGAGDAVNAGVDVVTPDIRDPSVHALFLQPLRDHRRTGATERTTLEVDGRAVACTKVEYLGGSYDQPASVWVDDGGLLLRYTWDQPGVGDWDVRIGDINGPWPVPRDW